VQAEAAGLTLRSVSVSSLRQTLTPDALPKDLADNPKYMEGFGR
jgi:hypothetical protein